MCSLQAVFIDSYAKMPVNIDDPQQQEAFDRETLKLWNTTQRFDTFAFKTLQVNPFCKDIKFHQLLL